jgi:hypothetical protein
MLSFFRATSTDSVRNRRHRAMFSEKHCATQQPPRPVEQERSQPILAWARVEGLLWEKLRGSKRFLMVFFASPH